MKLLRRITALLLSGVMLASLVPRLPSVSAAAYGRSFPTQDEIRAFYAAHPWSSADSAVFTEAFSLKAPYAPGAIDSKTLQSGLNCINFCRFAAGLPADLVLNEEYNKYSQAASLLSVANGVLSHSPAKPEGMSEELYQLGYQGAAYGNLSLGFKSLNDSITRGFLNDSDDYNISMLGHRRWVLYPEMAVTGLGLVGTGFMGTALYAYDESRAGSFTGDYVAWPCENMPYLLYNDGQKRYAFSVLLGDAYDYPTLDAVSVDMTSEMLGRSFHFDKSNNSDFDYYLNVDTNYCGIDKCIIFNPGVKFPLGDKVHITVSGLTKSGKAAPLSYSVNFFDLNAQSDGQSQTTEPPHSSAQPSDETTADEGPQKLVEYTVENLSLHTDDSILLHFSQTSGRINQITVSYSDSENNAHAFTYGGEYGDYLTAPGEITTAHKLVCDVSEVVVRASVYGELPTLSVTVEPAETPLISTTDTTAPPEPDLYGDVTCDGIVNIGDAVRLARVNAEDSAVSITAQGRRNADCDRNGTVNSDDAVMLLSYLAQNIDTLPQRRT